MLRTDKILDKLGGAEYITTLDLARGYWQVPLAEASNFPKDDGCRAPGVE